MPAELLEGREARKERERIHFGLQTPAVRPPQTYQVDPVPLDNRARGAGDPRTTRTTQKVGRVRLGKIVSNRGGGDGRMIPHMVQARHLSPNSHHRRFPDLAAPRRCGGTEKKRIRLERSSLIAPLTRVYL